MSNGNNPGQGGTFTYTVDGDSFSTVEHELTPRRIISQAGLDPSERYLIEVRGKTQVSYQNKMDEAIRIHEKIKFITAFVGPVPVS